jgi:diguanylate cyclase (GGDEF)-like protein/PAS domain S-box-containing protein
MIDVELIGAPAFTVLVTEDGFVYSATNDRLADRLGMAKSILVGREPQAVLTRDDAEVVLGHYRRCVAERRSLEFEGHYGAAGGGLWWRTILSPVLDGEEGRVVALIGLSIDITRLKLDEHKSREVDAKLALAMEVLDGGFWHYSIATREFRTSPQLSRRLTGRSDAEPLDYDGYVSCVLDEDHDVLGFGPLERGDCDIATVEYRIRTVSGDLRWVSCKRRLTRDEAGRPEKLVGVVVDITDQKSQQASLIAEASTDSLTDLVNRRGYETLGRELVTEALRHGTSFGLLLIDLDRFKPVNDTHGHPVGDAVLREVGARLRRRTRPEDVAVRLGGDEFAVLVRGATDDILQGLARRLVDSLGQPIVTSAGQVQIGASVGVARWCADDGNLAGLQERADEALLDAKRVGRGTWRTAA